MYMCYHHNCSKKHQKRSLTHLIDGASQGQIPVLAVHIVGTGARVVLDPDAVVLDDVTVLLGDLEWGSNNKSLGS